MVPTVVLMNPPFSVMANVEGRMADAAGQPPIEPVKLIVPMLERFIATDREFAKARRPAQSPKASA